MKSNISTILKDSLYFGLTVQNYKKQLSLHRDWSFLKKKLSECRKKNFSKENIRKLFEWERRSYSLYSECTDCTIKYLKFFSKEVTDEQFIEIKNWIVSNKDSIELYKNDKVDINSSLKIFIAKIIHLLFAIKNKENITIVELLKK